MTTKTPDHFPPNHEPITISFRKTASLVGALASLKALHAVVFVFKVKPESVQHAISRKEHRIVDISLSAIPDSLYRLKNEIDFAASTEGAHAPNNTPSECGCMDIKATTTEEDKPSSCFHSPIMQVSSSISPAIRMSQCILTPSADRPMESIPANTTGHAIDPVQIASESVYSPVVRRSETEGVIQSESSGLPENTPIIPSQYVQIVPYSQSRRSSLDFTELQLSNDSRARMKDLHSIRSVESYPGKFPVSDGLEFSSLASAQHRLRGRGTTSVRPFSDM
ncbi:hypothetical protein ASPWEDRAFT_208317 [Aspergillus wentii DTO 134E9]|uniref:Uncharacterized protein n=1 Tax=Aspergillus wentii DTO 134E9 TaxID=1073089 RepID=A0A1L9RZR5_ASPWE|nr:uncharacterized protein ASPWEDRAFT_208317 [Aspergillus wentii DTO 134E9]KAI9932823.1 hypothetical protein MW887_009075 [Aspergillus wentii]OJJ40405.1 hypothetical protein ASPWEDRAFT_208317 [Aspergillus wentii DTO 134E9]